MRVALLVLLASCKFHGQELADASLAPEQIVPPDQGAPEGDWAQVSLGTQHTCAIKTDGSLYCWGYNYWSVLGTGTLQSPFQQLAPLRIGTDTWKQVSAGELQTCAIKSDDTLWCWGTNQTGAVGTGTTMQVPAPTQITAMKWLAISASISHTCGIDSDHHRWCWGDGTYGELGDGLSGSSAIPYIQGTPKQIGVDTWDSIIAGYYMTCGIKTDGTLWCNGTNSLGQLGNNTTNAQTLPVQIGVNDKFYEVQTRFGTTCAHSKDGTLQCWGFNLWGMVGDGSTTQRNQPMTVALSTDWTAFGVGLGAVCGSHFDGRVECWGNDDFGEAGFADQANATTSPREVDTGGALTSYGMGDLNSCAITSKHALVCTGQTSFGQLANGAGIRTAPTQVLGQYARVAAGDQFTCAHTSAGATACWGFNNVQQLGLGDATPREVPPTPPVPTMPPLDLAAGGNDACELRGDHKAYCWGQNDHGQLDGATGMGPVVMATPMTVKNIAMRDHGCAIQNDNTIACWGPNDSGQLGNNSTAQATNAMVGGNWIALSTGAAWTCGIKNDHHLFCWGNDRDDEVPDSLVGPIKLNPVDVGNPFVAVSAGQTHGCAIKMDNTLQCWGFGTLDKATPVGTAQWKAVAAGNQFTCGIQMDGSLWCWGQNNTGQLGLGNFVNQAQPTQVGTETDWTSVTLGASHACATKSNLALYCWGLDDRGQLGLDGAWRDGWQAL